MRKSALSLILLTCLFNTALGYPVRACPAKHFLSPLGLCEPCASPGAAAADFFRSFVLTYPECSPSTSPVSVEREGQLPTKEKPASHSGVPGESSSSPQFSTSQRSTTRDPDQTPSAGALSTTPENGADSLLKLSWNWMVPLILGLVAFGAIVCAIACSCSFRERFRKLFKYLFKRNSNPTSSGQQEAIPLNHPNTVPSEHANDLPEQVQDELGGTYNPQPDVQGHQTAVPNDQPTREPNMINNVVTPRFED